MSRTSLVRHFSVLCTLALLAVTLFGTLPQAAQAQDEGTNYRPGAAVSTPSGYAAVANRAAQYGTIRVIVTLQGVPFGQSAAISSAQNQLSAALASTNATVYMRFAYTPAVAIEADQAAILALANDPNVAAIQEDIPVPPLDTSSNNVIGAAAAWAQGFDGAGWAVAVLDTGVQTTHPFLTGKTVAEACFSRAASSGGFTSVSVCPNGQSTGGAGQPAQTGAGSGINCVITTSGCNHGTHVAGIAVGKNYSGGPGYDGVARNGNLIALQVFSQFNSQSNCGSLPAPCALTWNSDNGAALDYLFGTLSLSHNVASANMSLGGGFSAGYCDGDFRKAAIDNLRNTRKIATVISAGNDGFVDGVGSPACISSSISVGATNDNDSIASYSNRYANLSLFAPGSSVDSSVPNNNFANFNGTSMAAPHVAGAWAVMKQKFPVATVSRILNVLRQKGPLIPNTGGTTYSIPRLQLDKSLADIGNKDTIGIYRPSTNRFYLRNSNTTGTGDIEVTLSGLGMNPDSPFLDVPITGDWNGDGIDTVGFYRRSTGEFVLSNSNTTPAANYYFVLGSPGDTPIAGDWNGDGKDGVGIFRPSNGLIYIKNTLATGFADYVMVLGIPGDVGLAGNWNNNDQGKDSPGVFRPSIVKFYLSNNVCNCSVNADYESVLGIPGDQGFTGDWDGDGRKGTGVFRTSNGLTYLRNDPTTSGFADIQLVFGVSGDYALAGRWSTAGPTYGQATSELELAPTFDPNN